MIRLLSVTLAVALCLGCGKGDGLNRASVEGKVSLDGAPVEQGSITFVPASGTKGPTAGGMVEKGRYSISAAKGPVVGQYSVEIHAPRKSGKKVQAPMAPAGTMTDATVDAAPAQYNSKSTLKKEVKAGRNEIDFDMNSDGKAPK
jgi:hypothetical protein